MMSRDMSKDCDIIRSIKTYYRVIGDMIIYNVINIKTLKDIIIYDKTMIKTQLREFLRYN